MPRRSEETMVPDGSSQVAARSGGAILRERRRGERRGRGEEKGYSAWEGGRWPGSALGRLPSPLSKGFEVHIAEETPELPRNRRPRRAEHSPRHRDEPAARGERGLPGADAGPRSAPRELPPHHPQGAWNRRGGAERRRP